MLDPIIENLRAVMAFLGNYSLTLAIIILIITASRRGFINRPKTAIFLMIPMVVAFTIIPINYRWWGCDYIVYAKQFDSALSLADVGSDALFGIFTYAVRLLTDNVSIYFALTSSLYLCLYILACKHLTKGAATLSLFALCFGGPFFISYMDNTLRAGLGVALVLVALGYLEKSRVKAIIFAIMAINMHFSMALPVVAIAASYFRPKPKQYLFVWVMCIFVSLAAGSYFMELFSGMVDDDRMGGYLMQDEASAMMRYKVGFRWDFLVYSLMPIAVGWYFITKKKYKDKLYKIIYSAYILANAFWVLVIRAPFSDRFAYLSWFLIPFIFGYPLLQKNTTIANPGKLYCYLLALTILIGLYI